MFKVDRLTVEHLERECITDNRTPRFAFTLSSDKKDVTIKRAVFSVGEWSKVTEENIAVYEGPSLKPCSRYILKVTAENNYGETAYAETCFETGLMGSPFWAKWISDDAYSVKDKTSSPLPMTFKKNFKANDGVKRALLYITSVGIYCGRINGARIGEDYFTPGFTAYDKQMQYQVYDITEHIRDDNELLITVAGGWACGSYTNKRRNCLYAKRQALLAGLVLDYGGGQIKKIDTDETWRVTEGYRFISADFYDGESYDATIGDNDVNWRSAAAEDIGINPALYVTYGAPVRRHEKFVPACIIRHDDGSLIYDCGQNFAGIVSFKVNGKKGQKIRIRHAEIITGNRLHTTLLRSAKATVEYICREGVQEYSPTFTYMGFRYIEVSGVREEDIELCAYALYSDVPQSGHFECSDERLNRLQQNIVFSAKSNFVDIPTDCPQRDERMGWTGDIALFAPTACFNFDMSRFFDKWLKDLRAEQGADGGIPDVIPAPPGTFAPATKAFWGDACILVPYEEYKKSGDIHQLKRSYPAMKKYLAAVQRKAEKVSIFKRKYILCSNVAQAFKQYGDWCSPDCGYYGWMLRSKWTATASLKNCASVVAEIAQILGDISAYKKYMKLAEDVSEAYIGAFTDGKGKLKKQFETAYVLPLQFGIFTGSMKAAAAKNLAAMVRDSGYKVMTGFPGTPYILFVLVENGYVDEAYRMLTNEDCPSWLYEVKTGGTTIWERWDALKEDGTININEKDKNVMVSFNHYAGGAVGDFLYQKILGLVPIGGGYKTFDISPVMLGGITSASGYTNTRYGKIFVSWSAADKKIRFAVPVGTTCHVRFMGIDRVFGSGNYELEGVS